MIVPRHNYPCVAFLYVGRGGMPVQARNYPHIKKIAESAQAKRIDCFWDNSVILKQDGTWNAYQNCGHQMREEAKNSTVIKKNWIYCRRTSCRWNDHIHQCMNRKMCKLNAYGSCASFEFVDA